MKPRSGSPTAMNYWAGPIGIPQPWHVPRALLKLTILLLVIIIGGLAVLYRSIHHDYGPILTTEIDCVDSITNAPIRADVNIIKDGGMDDDPDKVWGIGRQEGRLIAERNVWIIVQVTAPGYQSTQIALDSKSPKVMVVKLSRN
jgi:hypothetical protein